MKVLLINSNRELSPWPIIPVGVCRVATALDAAGFEVRVLDLTFADDPAREVGTAVAEFAPGAVGLSIRNIDDVDTRRRHFYVPDIKATVVDPIRAAAPSTPLVLGGSAVSIAPRLFLDYMGANLAVAGDGERAAVSLFRAIADGADPSGIPGVWTREGAAPAADAGPSCTYDRIEDLSLYPSSQAYRWVDAKRYASYGSRYGIQTKRGCDCTCTYCSYPSIEGTTYRRFSPSAVADEIADVVAHSPIDYFEFVDSTFNVPRDHAVAILDELASRKLPVRLDTMGLNPSTVDAELVAAMQRVGFNETSCTPESGSPTILKALGKQFGVDDIANAAQVLGTAGLRTKWYFMFGAPGENESTVAETFRFIDDHVPPQDLVIAMTGIRVLPGTGLETQLRRRGDIDDSTTLFEPFFIFGDLTRERLDALVAAQVAKRPQCCHASGELWNIPSLMRFLNGAFTTLGLKSQGWEILRLINRVRGLWRSTKAAG